MTERPDQSPLTSARSERVRKVAALAGRSARRKHGRFRIEGPQAVRSLLARRPDQPLEVFLTEPAAGEHPAPVTLARRAGVPLRSVDEQIPRALVCDRVRGDAAGQRAADAAQGTVVGRQGGVAGGTLPPEVPSAVADALAALPPAEPATAVVLDEVRGPGNVVTLLRHADAAGADL